MSERFALLEGAERIVRGDQATAVTFFDMKGRSMLNVELFVLFFTIEQACYVSGRGHLRLNTVKQKV